MHFKVRDEDTILRRIVRDLTRAEFSVSYNLVVPPCFGEERIARAAHELIRREHPETPLAVVVMDEIRDDTDFVRRLKDAWSGAITTSWSDAPHPSDELQRIFGALAAFAPVVLVVRRFHKILDTISAPMLGALRTAEQQRKLRALVLSPVSHRELKLRWDRERPLVVSDYGDSHRIELVHPPTEREFLAQCTVFGVPSRVGEWFFKVTGGYPDLADELLGFWHRNDQAFDASVRRSIPEEVVGRARRFVKWLDGDSGGLSRRHVLQMHYGIGRETAEEALRRHEWRDVLLHDGALRAQAVGEAAMQGELDALARGGSQEKMEQLAVMAYRARDFVAARRVYELLATRAPSRAVRLSMAHARAMDALFTDGDAWIGPHWSAVQHAVEEAQEIVKGLSGGAFRELAARHSALRAAARIAEPMKEWRAIDELSQPLANGAYEPARVEATLLLLVLEAEISRSLEAVARLTVLLQQTFAVWSLWRLQLRQDTTPVDHAGVWADVLGRLPSSSIALPPALVPGRRFESFAGFALFAVETWRRTGVTEPAPERNVEELLRVLERISAVRGEPLALEARRERFSRLVTTLDRWMAAAISATPVVTSLRTLEQLRDVVRPLPLMSSDGALNWDV